MWVSGTIKLKQSINKIYYIHVQSHSQGISKLLFFTQLLTTNFVFKMWQKVVFLHLQWNIHKLCRSIRRKKFDWFIKLQFYEWIESRKIILFVISSVDLQVTSVKNPRETCFNYFLLRRFIIRFFWVSYFYAIHMGCW